MKNPKCLFSNWLQTRKPSVKGTNKKNSGKRQRERERNHLHGNSVIQQIVNNEERWN